LNTLLKREEKQQIERSTEVDQSKGDVRGQGMGGRGATA